MQNETGNLEQVRAAVQGITGLEIMPAVREAPDSYLVIARISRERDTVDSLRRNAISACWPSYEELMPMRRQSGGGQQARRWRRVGILPGYVFAQIDPSRDFELLLNHIVGAVDIARTYSGNPLMIADADLQIIKRIEIGLNTPRAPDKSAHNFKLGEKVRFVDDLIGRWPAGRIVKLAPDGRISAEVELMGRKVPITVLPHQIARM